MSGRVEERLARRGGPVELLRLPAALFGLAAGLRARAYDRRLLPVHRLDVPVVCVGNLTAGGTGKTPLVHWLARWFEARGWRPGLLSRGYGAEAPGAGDEARMLAELLPGVPAVQDPDRVRGGRLLVERGVDVVLLDDGFQHRRLHRDRDLVLVDATRPWGLPPEELGSRPVRALLPRGLLREPPAALARADALVVTRSDQVEPAALEALEAELGALAPGAPIVRARHAPRRLRSVSDGAPFELDRLRGRSVDLVSGIGNPGAFERTVLELGALVREHRRLPDHHIYRGPELAGLGRGDVPVVTTAKDAVKLRALLPAALALEVEFEFASGRAPLEALLESIPAGAPLRARRALHEGLHG